MLIPQSFRSHLASKPRTRLKECAKNPWLSSICEHIEISIINKRYILPNPCGASTLDKKHIELMWVEKQTVKENRFSFPGWLEQCLD